MQQNQAAQAAIDSALHQTQLGSWSWDLSTNKCAVSDRLCRLLGAGPDAAHYELSALMTALVHSDDRERVHTEILQQRDRGATQPLEFRLHGSAAAPPRFARLEGDTERDPSGRAVRFVGILHDVSERKNVEDLFRAVVDAAPHGMLVVDRTGVIRLINREIERQFGYQRDELLGRSIEMLLPESFRAAYPGFREGFANQPRASAMGGGVRELLGLRKDGSELPVEIGLNPVMTPAGPHTLASMVDITSRKIKEEQLRQSENHLRVLIDSIEDHAIFMLDPDGRVMSWNRGAEMTMGYKSEDVRDRHYSMFFSEEDRKRGKPQELLKIAAANGKCEDVGARLNRHGISFWASVTISSVLDSNQHLLGYSHVARDLTRNRKIVQELRVAKEQAEAADQTKAEFLANISHEIRTPMTGVIGMAGLLAETELTAQQRSYCDIVLGSSRALLTVINEILDFSKLEAGKVELETIEFDVRSLVEEVTELYVAGVAAKNIELISFIRFDVPAVMRGDPGRLRQVLANLVNNAVKFTARGEIVVRVSRVTQTASAATLRFEVADTGIGISKSASEEIFNPFTQVDASMTRKYGGTGLGLTISKKYVDLMGGELGVDSESGKGSVFWFTVPLLLGARPQLPTPRLDLKGLHVLVAEGNSTSRTVIQHYLESLGVKAQYEQNGCAALAQLRCAFENNEPYALVLLDARLPDMNGLEFAQTIRQDPRFEATKLVLLTSVAARGDAELAKEAGMDAYITKPVSLSCLSESIAYMMGEGSDTDIGQRLITRHTLAEMKAQNRMRVLVVDDNHINQKVAASLLANMGHRADVVGSGKEALEACKLIDYEMILMDLQMPEMDGFIACKSIRALATDKNHSIPIVAITAHAMKGDREKCLKLGFDGYISKPINPKELRAAADAISSGKKKPLLATSEKHPSGAPGSLDLAKALAQLEGDRQLLVEISQIFIETYPQLLEQIHNALAGSNQQQLIAAAHTLASSAGQIGAVKGHAMAKELEEIGRRNELSLATGTAAELDAEIRLVASAISSDASPYSSLPLAEA